MTIDSPPDIPDCATDAGSTRPAFSDGPPLTWGDDGGTRYACVHIPDAGGEQLPLVVFLHGSHGGADDLYDYTSLRSKSDSYPLSGDGGPVGFAIASLQGRNLHWEGQNPAGTHFDHLYRDLGSPSGNPDIRSVDRLIETLAATGKVDPARIYVTGWSNGAFFAQEYAAARFTTATPGLDGPPSRIAAAAPYAGADPFAAPDDAALASCAANPYPQTDVPIFAIHRDCDALVPCDAAQLAAPDGGTIAPPGYAVETWLATLGTTMGDAAVQDEIVDGSGVTVSACASSCGEILGGLNHLHWPDGVADRGGHDHEPEMLDFLRAHPHP
ncbi:MAG: hypothetical protein JST54_24410 [Deltaproteobacteria bacterium]|nr:hypothetical protein [Deltaproteobacteria bacterium]